MSVYGISRFIQSNSFQIAAQILTVSGLLLASYVTIRIFPLILDLDRLSNRVSAVEEKQEKTDTIVTEFIDYRAQTQEHFKNIDLSLTDIRSSQRDILNEQRDILKLFRTL